MLRQRCFALLAFTLFMPSYVRAEAVEAKPLAAGRSINQVPAQITAANFTALNSLATRLRDRKFQMKTIGQVPASSRTDMLIDDEWRSLNRVESDIVDVLVPFQEVSERGNPPRLSNTDADSLIYLFGVLLTIDGSAAPAGHFLDTYLKNKSALDGALARLDSESSRAAITQYLRNHLVVDQDTHRR